MRRFLLDSVAVSPWQVLLLMSGEPCGYRDGRWMRKEAFNAQVAGEGYKFAVTLLLFAVVFKSYAQLAALPLFLAYAATVVVYWMALLRQQ
jgi:F0F1-type ATP synthase assembly protein I